MQAVISRNPWPKMTLKKHIAVISGAIWYLDGNHHKIQERAVHGDVHPILERFVYTTFIL